MSKQQTSPKSEPQSNVAPIKTLDNAPDSFERLGSPDIDGYYDPKSQQVVVGRIAGWKSLATKFGTRDVVLITLAQDCIASIKDGDVFRNERLAVGKVIAVGVGADQGLQELNSLERGSAVWLKAAGTRSTKRGTMHVFDVRAQKGAKLRTKTATAPAAEAPENMPEDESEEIPF